MVEAMWTLTWTSLPVALRWLSVRRCSVAMTSPVAVAVAGVVTGVVEEGRCGLDADADADATAVSVEERDKDDEDGRGMTASGMPAVEEEAMGMYVCV